MTPDVEIETMTWDEAVATRNAHLSLLRTYKDKEKSLDWAAAIIKRCNDRIYELRTGLYIKHNKSSRILGNPRATDLQSACAARLQG